MVGIIILAGIMVVGVVCTFLFNPQYFTNDYDEDSMP